MKLSDYGEKRLIAEVLRPIFERNSAEVPVGVGDDAAVMRLPAGHELVATIDKAPERLIGLELGAIGFESVGWFLVAANVSDLAAMGADPVGLLVSLALPGEFPVSALRELAEGIQAAALWHDIPVVGGDTKGASAPAITAAALGSLPSGTALRRDGAQSGDLVCVTGQPGPFAAALAFLLLTPNWSAEDDGADTLADRLVQALRHPTANIAAGRALRNSGVVTACQDVSDGVGQTMLELALASSVGVEIDGSALMEAADPCVRETADRLDMDPQDILLGAGSEFELVFTVAPGDFAAVRQCLESASIPMSAVGRVDASQGLRVRDGTTTRELRQPGFEHFSGLSDRAAVARRYRRRGEQDR